MTTTLIAKAERYFRRAALNDYPVTFKHRGQSYRLDWVSRFGSIVKEADLIASANDRHVIRLCLDGDMLFRRGAA